VGGRRQQPLQLLFNGVPFLKHLMIPNTKHPKSLAVEPTRPFGVRFDLLRVLAAVKFEYQPSLQANEIDDVWSEYLLATELESADLPVPDSLPSARFRVRHVLPQVSGEVA
jgi:hypothetical protein